MSVELGFAVPSGEFIAEWMEGAGINAAELARRLGVSRKHVSLLLSGKAPLSHATALALERVTGIPARLWNRYEAGYREALARLAEKDVLVAQYDEAKAFPLTYLRKCGYITARAGDKGETVRQLLDILGVASLEALWETWAHGGVAYRRATVSREDAPALAVWLSLAERERDALGHVPPFDRGALEALIPTLRSLTRDEPGEAIEDAKARLLTVGVVLCLVPPVPRLGVYGATRWINGTPVVQLSLLGKSDDQLWFTLFHELGHVLLHGHRDLYLLGDQGRAEAEANEYAAAVLVPEEFRGELPRKRSISAVEALAVKLDVAPSIVLGQAQRLTGDYQWGHGLRRKFVWVVEGEDEG